MHRGCPSNPAWEVWPRLIGGGREKDADMQSKLANLVMLSAAIAVTTLYHADNVWATPADGFTATTLVKGTFGDIDGSKKSAVHDSMQDERRANVWSSLQKTEGPSDLYVQRNVWQPGGSTGWHTHPGHSLIIVTKGTVTDYLGSDPDCKPHVYTKDMTFVDSGGDHVHILRNEGKVVAQTIVVQLIPASATRRIDVPDPGNCHF
jgi:mannose-6-phosphate isomerase-like protein (cupin superfamily)